MKLFGVHLYGRRQNVEDPLRIKVIHNVIETLQMLCVLPKNLEDKSNPKLVYFMISTAIIYLPAIYYAIANWQSELPIYLFAETMYGLVIGLLVTTVSYFYSTHSPLFYKLTNQLGDYTTFGKPDFAEQRHKLIQTATNAYYLSTIVVSIVYIFLQVLTSYCWNIKEKYTVQIDCGIGGEFLYPFNVHFFPVNYIVFIINFICMIWFHPTGYIYFFTVFAITEYLVIKIDHLILNINKDFLDVDENELRKKVTRIIAYHTHIIEMVELFSEFYRYPITLQITLSSFTYALALFRLAVSPALRAGMFMLWFLVGIFTINWSAQRLLNKSQELTFALYNTHWYDAPVSIQKLLLMMIMRAQKYFPVRAVFVTPSLEAFLTVITRGYTYFTMFNRIN